MTGDVADERAGGDENVGPDEVKSGGVGAVDPSAAVSLAATASGDGFAVSVVVAVVAGASATVWKRPGPGLGLVPLPSVAAAADVGLSAKPTTAAARQAQERSERPVRARTGGR
jgi:hypothetical protein